MANFILALSQIQRGKQFSLMLFSHFILGCKFCFFRKLSIQPVQQKKIPNRYLGQPSPFTHPHLLKPGKDNSNATLSTFTV